MKEIWKDIEGWETLYAISNLGNVLSKRRNKKLKPVPEGGGYLQVYLCNNGKYQRCVVHRLVATHFISNPDNKPEVNHIDANKSNNKVENLEWVTPSENIRHSFEIGLINRGGENHPSNKLTEDDVRTIKKMLMDGVRMCEIEEKFKGVISRATICDIKAGRTWKNVKL